MAAPSVTNTFVNGTAIDATQVNTNFSDIVSGLNTGGGSGWDLSINALTCSGAATLDGAVTLGNAAGDDITVTGSLASSIPIKTTYSYDIGAATLGLRKLYFGSDDSGAFSTYLEAGTNASSYGLKLPDADGAAKDYIQTDGSGQLSFVAGPAIVTKSGTYTATTADKIIHASTSSAAWELGLYAASGNSGRMITIMKTNSDWDKALTINANSTETINGVETIKLLQQYEQVTLLCDGSNWVVIDHTYPSAWASYTPTDQGWDAGSWEAAYKRVGDSFLIRAKFVPGTTTSSEAQIGLPNSLTVASGWTQVPCGNFFGEHLTATAHVIMTSGDSFLNASVYLGADTNFAPQAVNGWGYNGKDTAFVATVPITDLYGG